MDLACTATRQNRPSNDGTVGAAARHGVGAPRRTRQQDEQQSVTYLKRRAGVAAQRVAIL